MDHFQRELIPISLAITAVVAVSWWVNYELIPVMNVATSFLPIYLLVLTARVVLGLAYCCASVGIGLGGGVVSTICYRHFNRTKSHRTFIRYAKKCLATIVALFVFVVSYGIGFISIGASDVFALGVMFVGLQVGEVFLLCQFLRWRRVKETAPS